MKIWLRLVVSILLSVIVSGAGLIYWATLEQRKIAVDQAREFANSVHQMTLAGLTGMMITGTVPLRPIFLDQIKEMNHIESLKVIRGEPVVHQFGPGLDGETLADPLERGVLDTGEAVYTVFPGHDGNDRMRAIIPARALENYLGKNCTNCHEVKPGTVLGAVSMEISLAQASQTARLFSRNAVLAAGALCLPLGFFIWMFISRMVSRPLAKMAEGLDQVAAGNIDEAVELPVHRPDEVGVATAAFNRVMGKAHELLREQRMARIVFENSLEGITVTDANSRIVMVNKAFSDTTGYSAGEAIGQTPAMLKSGKHGEDFYTGFWNALQERGEWRGEIWNRRKNGSVYPEWLNVSAVRNGKGEIEHYIAIFTDITERKEREEKITYQAFHDALTGLPNRLLFRDRLEQALAQAKRNKYRTPAIMFLDLDRFKQINDTLGHEAGDLLLKEVANRLRRCVRSADTVARLAGDEFTVLLPEITEETDARAAAEKILSAMLEPISLGAESRVVSTSIGISMFPRDGRDADSLMKHADAAMYSVKDSGRAGMSFFAPELLGKPTRRADMENRLQAALGQRQFELHFQPIFDLETGAIHGREALLRWRQPDGSVIMPEEFISMAEELGLMTRIGEWVLENACVQARDWQSEGAPVVVSVNLSAAEFQRPDLVQMVLETLRRASLAPQLLEIEISEMLAMHDAEYTIRVLGELAAIGVTSVIDDFGTGYSNLMVLKQLPVQGIKIDRSLIRDEIREPDDQTVLGAIFGVARALGLRTVAEGIETESELAAVRDLACHHGQGHILEP